MRKKIIFCMLCVVLISGVALWGWGRQHAAKETKNIIEVAQSAGAFKTLLNAFETAGLASTLKGMRSFTIFAPHDAAFAALPKGMLDNLLKNKKELRSLLTSHMVSGKWTANNLLKKETIRTINGRLISIREKNGKVMIENAEVMSPDIVASNGVIQIINAVLILPK